MRQYVDLKAMQELPEVRPATKRVELDIVLYDPQKPGSYPWRVGVDMFEMFESGSELAGNRIGAGRIVVHQIILGADS